MATATDDNGVSRRLKNAATILVSDNQAFLADIGKAYLMMKDVAVDLEKDNQTAKVKLIEESVCDLILQCDEVGYYAAAVESVAHSYQHSEDFTDFKKLLESEAMQLKNNYATDPQNHNWMRQLKEAVWNVHRSGKKVEVEGEEQEDVVLTCAQTNLLNIICPLSGKPIAEVNQPVRSSECKHIYDLDAIRNYISSNRPKARCPIAGCPKMLQMKNVVCDPVLNFEIEELRNTSKQSARQSAVEDFTARVGVADG